MNHVKVGVRLEHAYGELTSCGVMSGTWFTSDILA